MGDLVNSSHDNYIVYYIWHGYILHWIDSKQTLFTGFSMTSKKK
jgi:hypothetical protein